MTCTFEPPPEALCRLPSCEIILDAIALNLPLKSPNSTNVVNITRWFSKASPNADISCIKHLTIPSDTILSKLSVGLAKAWDNGYAQSMTLCIKLHTFPTHL